MISNSTSPKNISTYEFLLAALLATTLSLCVAVGWIKASPIEVVAVISAFASVWLGLRESPLTWPTFMVNTLSFAWIYWTLDAYANTGLQAVQFILALRGWYLWGLGLQKTDNQVISRTKAREWAFAAALVVSLCILLLVVRVDEAPWLVLIDAASTGLATCALILQARKRLEYWLLNAASVFVLTPLFFLNGAGLLAMLSPLFIAWNLVAYVLWQRRLHASKAKPPGLDESR
jgi:nicotinamide mononucleotide transporter